MFRSKLRLYTFKEQVFLLKKTLNVSAFSIFVLLNISAISAFSLEKQSKDNLLETSLEVAISEFYPPSNPIASFYVGRNFEPFWVKSERRLENLISSISEAKLHGLPLSR